MTEQEKKEQKTKAEQAAQTSQTGYNSQWSDQINDLLDKYQNREDFAFDVDKDALYQQYKDQYIRNGKLAMADTMGQAAALTGGYGNSYAQSVGQQTYNQYLEGLNDRVPELYEMALEQYTRAGNDLLTQYGLLLDRDNQDYSRWQDQASLARSQVETLLGMGMRPSDELLNQSGLSSEYISALLSRGSSRGGGGSGGNSGGSRRTSDGSQDQGIDIEKEYLAMKQAGAKDRETDNYLKSAISAGLISNKAATELRNKRY